MVEKPSEKSSQIGHFLTDSPSRCAVESKENKHSSVSKNKTTQSIPNSNNLTGVYMGKRPSKRALRKASNRAKRREQRLKDRLLREKRLRQMENSNKASIFHPSNLLKIQAANTTTATGAPPKKMQSKSSDYDPTYTPWKKGKRHEKPDFSSLGDHQNYFYAKPTPRPKIRTKK